MGHPIFKEAPSTDMTKPQKRQAELDTQIAEFLAKGGEIKVFDNLCRPIESGPWRAKSIHSEQQKPVQAEPIKAKPATPVKAKPVPEQPRLGSDLTDLQVQPRTVVIQTWFL